ncbi:SMC-Scp complex subunit ScpB [Microbulbifer yueqingensis]|uniref:Segregation and condensation protein B n=1 Tax=Microbulbifer yueqingensis TaxID=658219 RepID=A0A1G8UX13_9GAMM|nr:SMC-Scp complex subunit ScpB [Microbulbifer yueqingensis]SDJ58406.1 segregation and condensation protein B [Microbulbifer yueqingensis]
MTIAPELLRRIVEGALLAAGQPLNEDKLLSLIDEGERPEKSELRQVLQDIADSCAERGFELRQVASGWRYQVPEDLAPWVNRLWEEKPQKYSRAILETLAIIAYRQPITRGDIEEIRGVAVSSHIVKTLTERGWIKVVGQRDVPGKPSLYATTREFLDYFNLRSLDELPTLAEIRDIESLNQSLDLGGAGDDLAAGDNDSGEGADQSAAMVADAEENLDPQEGETEAVAPAGDAEEGEQPDDGTPASENAAGAEPAEDEAPPQGVAEADGTEGDAEPAEAGEIDDPAEPTIFGEDAEEEVVGLEPDAENAGEATPTEVPLGPEEEVVDSRAMAASLTASLPASGLFGEGAGEDAGDGDASMGIEEEPREAGDQGDDESREHMQPETTNT